MNIKTVIEESLGLLENQLLQYGIILKMSIPENLPEIKAFSRKLQQVFINIINNALYALNKKYPGSSMNKILGLKTYW